MRKDSRKKTAKIVQIESEEESHEKIKFQREPFDKPPAMMSLFNEYAYNQRNRIATHPWKDVK